MQVSKYYQVQYQYVNSKNEVQDEWIVTLSHRTPRAMKQYTEVLRNMKAHPYKYLKFGYNKINLIKTEEIYLFCISTVKHTVVNSYCTEHYLDKMENDENDDSNSISTGSTTTLVSNPSTVLKRKCSPLVKIPSPDSRAPRRVNFSSEQIAKGEEYFDIMRVSIACPHGGDISLNII
jgi:hypothetical protein